MNFDVFFSKKKNEQNPYKPDIFSKNKKKPYKPYILAALFNVQFVFSNEILETHHLPV